MTDTFPTMTANQLTLHERDKAYAELHEGRMRGTKPPVLHDEYGVQIVYAYDDVKEVMAATSADLSNRGSLDPLDGYGAIVRNPRTFSPFLRHLVPLPARATANATGPMHRKVWRVLNSHFRTTGEHARPQMEDHFDAAWSAANDHIVDLTTVSIDYAARITSQALGLEPESWQNVAAWSGAQSKLLGRRIRGREQAEAVNALGELFTVSKQLINRSDTRTPDSLQSKLEAAGVPKRIAVAALANCLAAGVHTVAGTIQQGTERLLVTDRKYWDSLDDSRRAVKIAQRALRLDPGLVGWKRTVTAPTELTSGTKLERGVVIGFFGAANRDTTAVSDPYSLEVSGKRMLTFGIGEHTCPGSSMAVQGIATFLHKLHRLAPDATATRVHPERIPRDLLFSGADLQIATNHE